MLNSGCFEVESHISTTLTVRGIGTVDVVEGFSNSDFITTVSDAVITKVNLSVIRAGVEGDWESGKGSVTPLSFRPISHNTGVIKQLGTSSTNADFLTNPQTLLSEVVQRDTPLSKITFSFESSNTTTNRSTEVGLYIDGVLVDSTSSIEPKDVRNRAYQCKVVDHDLSGSPHTLEVRWGRSNGSGSSLAEISNVRIFDEDIR